MIFSKIHGIIYFMKQYESVKRIIILQLRLLYLFVHGVMFAYMWYHYYTNDLKVVYFNKGNWVVIGIYMFVFIGFSNMYSGMRIGQLKTVELFLSQLFSSLCVNVFAYALISLLVSTYAKPLPLVALTGANIVWIIIWSFIANAFYSRLFPPRQLLLIHGRRPIDNVKEKFDARKDKYKIIKSMSEKEGLKNIYEEISNKYDGVVLWDLKDKNRNKLIKYCYSKSIRIYVMPKISDVILLGSDKLHVFDSPMLLTKEFALTVEQRFMKRSMDVILSLILIILTSPIMLITAVIIKSQDKGPVFYKQVRATRGQMKFKIVKFRSMRVDAESDGVARLAVKNDNRITPFGKFIRKVRIDELPQLFNILKGEMSFIGPRPERPEIIEQYLKEMPEFAYRMKVNAGLAGYAQVFGKYNTLPYDKLKLDLQYIQNYSIWLDIKLMFLTLKILFSPDSTEGVEEGKETGDIKKDKTADITADTDIRKQTLETNQTIDERIDTEYMTRETTENDI